MRRLARYIEGLHIGQGRHAGTAFKLLPWQRRFLAGAFGNGGNACLSVSRGNGKSTLCAAIAAATVDVDGPLVAPMAENLLVASSYAQGLTVWRHVLHFLEPSLAKHPKRFRVRDSANVSQITDRETGALLRVMGSDHRRLHGVAPRLILADEVAQWANPALMLAALRTSRGKIPDAKLLMIGTRAASAHHPFEVALHAGTGYVQCHAADPDADPFLVPTWKQANPSWAHMPDLQRALRQEAADAKRDAAALAMFRALRLNQGVSEVAESRLLDEGVWEGIETTATWDAGEPYVLGLDLGQNAAMSAACAFGLRSGTLDSFAVFPTEPGLADRGRTDGVGSLYEAMASRGELLQRGDRVADVRGLLREVLQRWGRPVAIACDRWREAELKQHLDEVGFPLCDLDVRGAGFQDGAADVRAFRAACLSGSVRPVKSLLLRSAMSEARLVGDAAGNWKLAKGRQGGRRWSARDDAAAAGIVGVACGTRRRGAADRQQRSPVLAIIR